MNRDEMLDRLADLRVAPEADTAAVILLVELREWFAGEVNAGDTALQLWVNKIDAVLAP